MVGASDMMMLLGGGWGATVGASFGGSFGMVFGVVGFFCGGLVGLFVVGFGWSTLDSIADRSGAAYRASRTWLGSLWLTLYFSAGITMLLIAMYILRFALSR
jgi:hypothetical protein